MESHCTYLFAWLISVQCLQGSSMLYHVSEFHSFSSLNNIPLYAYITFYLFIHQWTFGLFPPLVHLLSRVQLRSPMDWSMPGFPVLHCLLESAQTHPLFGYMNNTANKPWCTSISLSLFSVLLGIYPKVELLNHLVIYVWCLEELPYCFPQWLHHFTFSSTSHKGSSFSASLSTIIIFFFSW